MLPVSSSKPTAKGDVFSRAAKKSGYCSTLPVSSAARVGSSFPSVCATSKTETTINFGILISCTSVTGFPSAPIMGCCVSGSSFSTCFRMVFSVGAIIRIPFSSAFTWRLISGSFHALKPMTWVASGACMAIKTVFRKLYVGNFDMTRR